MRILSNAVNSPSKLTYGREGWYFAENGEHTHKDLGVRLGQVLYELGAVESPEPVYLTPEEVNAGAPVSRAVSPPVRSVLMIWRSIGGHGRQRHERTLARQPR